jgi:hypothetical protein
MGRRRLPGTDDQPRTVKALAGYGLSHKDIAQVVGLDSVDTLRQRFQNELTLGRLEAQSNLLSTCFRSALAGNAAAIMFWLKTRAGWSERGPRKERDAPSHTIFEIREHAPPRSPEQQRVLEELLRRQDAQGPPPARWEGDPGWTEDEEDEAPRRRRRFS